MLRLNYLRLVRLPMLLFILAACPARPPVTDCTPNTTRCSADGTQPEVCSASRRWQPTGTESCPAETACCLTVSIEGGQIHRCAVAADCVEPLPGGQYDRPAAPSDTPVTTKAARGRTLSGPGSPTDDAW